jgi:ATP/maltotriose-dependent transcriptional regulator MalT
MVRVKPFAKITKPALTGVFPRRRLLHRFDSAFSLHAIVWVGAPAGTGKTMLASSFAHARKKPCLWYGIDARDADPASFFFYMRAAAAHIAPHKAHGLALPPQGLAVDLAAYTRSFFEELGARLPAGTALVIDDFHELPDASPLQPLIPVALASLPRSVRVLVASRASPPASFARLIAHGRLACVRPEELDLTNDEIEQLARVRKLARLGPKRAAAVRERTGGWMAGTILVLERSAAGLAEDGVIDPSVREVLFEYFDSQIFERAPAPTRRFLLETALLPNPSVDAALLLTGEERSAEILSSLVRRNWFTVRLAGANARYQYHPLFREFLLAHARRAFPGDQWVVVTRRAADVLRRKGAFEDAAALMTDVGDHESLARLVVDQAPALLAEGRLATIEGWIRALPAGIRETNARVSYWCGICRSPFSPSEARTHLDRAYRLFKANDDSTGMLVAWAGLVTTFFYVWDEFSPLDHWIAELEALRRHHPEFPSLDVEGHVTLGMMSSLMWRQSGHPDIDRWVDRAASLLRSDLALELRMQLATCLALYRLWWKRDDAGAARLLEETRPLVAGPNVAPETQLLWWVTEV